MYIAKPLTRIFRLQERCAMRSSSLNLLCRTANRQRRAAAHPFSSISSPRRSKKLSSRRSRSRAVDGAPLPHGETARTHSAESTDEHTCRISRLYFRKHPDFLAKHVDFLQLLLKFPFPHARRCAHSASFRFLPSPFTSELKTLNSKHLR